MSKPAPRAVCKMGLKTASDSFLALAFNAINLYACEGPCTAVEEMGSQDNAAFY